MKFLSNALNLSSVTPLSFPFLPSVITILRDFLLNFQFLFRHQLIIQVFIRILFVLKIIKIKLKSFIQFKAKNFNIDS